MTGRLKRGARGAVSIAGLIALIAVLHAAARFDLRGPDDWRAAGIERWLEDPVTVAATVLRWIALVCCYYLLAVAMAVVFLPEQTLDAGLGHVIPARVIALFTILIGVAGVSGTTMQSTPTSTSAKPEPEAALSFNRAEDPLSLHRVTSDGSSVLDAEVDSQVVDRDDTNRGDPDLVWTVEPGDHLWSIATETLQDSWSRSELTDAEIVGYWREVIEANRERLVEPDNPDLILPGQKLVLPDAPSDPRAA